MLKLLPLIYCLCFLSANSQKLEGKVYGIDGNILPFASLVVKGTQQGAIANTYGSYSLPLAPGTYTVQCMHVGYITQEKTISIAAADVTENFSLALQKLTLKEVIITEGGEDPAYAIIREAIKKRPFYDKQVRAFEAEIYIKGIIKLQSLPQKILGQKIPDEDRSHMALDSAGKGIVYLSESVTKLAMQAPDKVKLEVVSGRESGSNGFGFNFPAIISFYENNVNMFSSQINPRGFVSPIADNALAFYRYKFLGSFFENGKEINTIRVTPLRNYEPLFSGIINITEDDWRIYSCELLLTKKSQLEILDSLSISQIHAPLTNDVWRIRSQVLRFSFNQLGIGASGDFVNVYSQYNLKPIFSKNYFDRIVIKYDTAVNKKTPAYWDSIRPVPLTPEELKDYQVKDSLYKLEKDSASQRIDSLKKQQGKVQLKQLFWTGTDKTYFGKKSQIDLAVDPLLKVVQYNTVEGIAFNPSFVFSKVVKSINSKVSLVGNLRYGFSNHHFNGWGGLNFGSQAFNLLEKNKQQSFYIAGGKRVSQFFKESAIDGLGNSISTLLYGRNDMKIYENYFAKAGFKQRWESGVGIILEGEYENRLPLDNTSDFILTKKYRDRFTPNYPVEILSSQFVKHQAVLLHASISVQPGQQYIQLPKSKISIGSKYPTFTLDYMKGFRNILSSDVDFDKWAFDITDNLNLKLAGLIKYKITLGGFLNTNAVFIQDYKHFFGNTSHVAKEYLQTFQAASYYEFSNTSSFYSEFHLEHHFNGLLTNKIPLFKKLNWFLVDGANALYIDPATKYLEVLAGVENIFKLLRFDVVAGFQNGRQPVYTYRIGFDGLLGAAVNASRFSLRKKIINNW